MESGVMGNKGANHKNALKNCTKWHLFNLF